MIHIKNNPPLTLDAIEEKIKTPFNTLVVPLKLEKVAKQLFEHFAKNVFKFEITVEEAYKKHLMEFRILVEDKLKYDKWILITEGEVYYSNGDGSNN